MPRLFGVTVPAILLALALVPAAARSAHAGDQLDLAYFSDGHALVVYGSVLTIGGLALFLDAPDEPRFFDPDEGGAPHRGDTVPYVAVGALAGLAGGAVLVVPTESRWYHLKGMAEAIATTALATDLSKRTFGRHRPDFAAGDPLTDNDSSRRSFFSGHASLTVASTTYLGLYLRQHLFSRWRQGSSLPWWEATAYAGLATIAVYVPLSRVIDNRHHPSDVITGALVGASMSTLFYVWQERRFRRSRARRLSAALPGELAHRTRAREQERMSVTLVPLFEPAGMGVLLRF